jgi:hypothetical protein
MIRKINLMGVPL